MSGEPLDVDAYRRARAVFDEVVDLPRVQRGSEIARLTQDPEVVALVERLLAADDEAGDDDLIPSGTAWATAELDDDEPPDRLGQFRILRELGRGAMGVVYEAEQDAPRRRVAVKTLHPLKRSDRARDQFRTEVDALGRVLHPGIPQVYEVFETEDGIPAMAMELVDGGPLLQAVYLLDWPARAEMLAMLCDAVDHAHRHGVIHRDLKPDNVLVTPAGQPKVLDFGVARLDGTYLPLAGTLAYLAPEQLEGAPPDVASDVYGLGAVGWEIVTGTRPVALRDDEDLAALAGRKRSLPDAPGEVPTDLVALLHRALAADPGARFHSARSMAQALRALAAEAPVATTPGTDPFAAFDVPSSTTMDDAAGWTTLQVAMAALMGFAAATVLWWAAWLVAG